MCPFINYQYAQYQIQDETMLKLTIISCYEKSGFFLILQNKMVNTQNY